uniref:Uncharacterized protein n=1 Tax=Knipowitschia caucasica TaxID=637954 RepID=A0AAV2JT34_KNICA
MHVTKKLQFEHETVLVAHLQLPPSPKRASKVLKLNLAEWRMACRCLRPFKKTNSMRGTSSSTRVKPSSFLENWMLRVQIDALWRLEMLTFIT